MHGLRAACVPGSRTRTAPARRRAPARVVRAPIERQVMHDWPPPSSGAFEIAGNTRRYRLLTRRPASVTWTLPAAASAAERLALIGTPSASVSRNLIAILDPAFVR